ncbi:MAG TPA: acyl-CoA thioesterase [Devosiaceae bacterium]|jgi:4-hydroxybenzoyl-CoA thioesterase|nr:acyl-CoA thioesterase [Devosiaceae bacterium]
MIAPRTAIREVEIEFGDCDPAGIVFYPNYFRFFDAATAGLLFEALGSRKSEWLGRFDVVGIPMVDTGAKFLRPSRFGDVVRIETTVTAIGRSSFQVAHRLLNSGELAVEAHEKRVWAGRAEDGSLRARTIPDEVRLALGHPPAS